MRDRFSATRWADLLGEWFPHLVSTELQHSRFAEIAPYHELIDELLKTNTVTTSISGCGTSGALGGDHDVPSLRVGEHARPPGQPRQGHRAKDDPPPGQEAQIDYGDLGQWTDPASGKTRAGE